MSPSKYVVAAALSAVLFGAADARAGANAPLCFALQNSFNQCMMQQQRLNARGAYDRRWSGWGDDGWDEPYEYERRRRWRQQRALNKQAECARWLYAIQRNNCAQ